MKKIKRIFVFLLIFSLLTLEFESFSMAAKSKNLSVEQAKRMGLANSSSYALLESKLELAQVQRDQAVKALKLKEKNQTTFRWSPLMDFKFPEEPNLVEAFEYKYKPEELGSNIEVPARIERADRSRLRDRRGALRRIRRRAQPVRRRHQRIEPVPRSAFRYVHFLKRPDGRV